ncbi:hypothetical protein [Pelosinus sp. IPA-1]|uniref:hypothetical protein n=1 Tax=Pelosinus sp. IPA-1 TaxID=3029569 RepID=UPI0024361EAA|nr:hypothetical protein [Pelosinus sp. IPA-1]GMA97773.1 hypothetical protein PIPA1_05730 [Pelosinus sp. IPA-1]
MEIQEQMSSLANTAVRYAQKFNEKLDFSRESIKVVEEILEYYFQDLQNCAADEKPSEEQVWSMALIWGAYIGEVMRRELGPDYIWSNEEKFEEKTPHILKVGKSQCAFPINKVHKRLLNGPEDNIVSFVDVLIDVFENGMPK